MFSWSFGKDMGISFTRTRPDISEPQSIRSTPCLTRAASRIGQAPRIFLSVTGRLEPEEIRVTTIGLEERIVRPALFDSTSVHHEDLIGQANCRESMRDEDRHASLGFGADTFEEGCFRRGIDRGGGLVE